MQSQQSKQEVNDTTIPKDVLKKFDDRKREELHSTIEDFYQLGGLTSPIDNLLESVQDLFNGIDSFDKTDLNEDGTPKRLYQMYTPDALSNKIFETFQLIRFLIDLNEKFERSPDNPQIKRNSIS